MYSFSELDSGIQDISSDRYLGTDAGLTMFTNKDTHDFIGAPRKAVLDLKTMKILKLDPLVGDKMSFQQVLNTCRELK